MSTSSYTFTRGLRGLVRDSIESIAALFDFAGCGEACAYSLLASTPSKRSASARPAGLALSVPFLPGAMRVRSLARFCILTFSDCSRPTLNWDTLAPPPP